MMERRIVRRSRVCLEGAVAAGLTGPIAPVRVRNLSGQGAEVVVAGGQLASVEVELAIPGRDCAKKARVVWRRMDRFGLEFLPEWPAGPADDAPAMADEPGASLHRVLAERARRAG